MKVLTLCTQNNKGLCALCSLTNKQMLGRIREEQTMWINSSGKTPNALTFFFLPRVPRQFSLWRTTDVLYFILNWLDWKIQQEIMRSDIPELCQRWKAWGDRECFKKCRAVSRLDEPYIHGKHIKSNLSDCYQPPCVLYWKADPDLTKDKQSYSMLFTPCIWIQRGTKQAITVLFLLYSKSCLFIPPVFMLYLRVI